MRAVLALALTTGCGFSTPGTPLVEGQTDDASAGMPDACATFSQQLDSCAASGADLTLSGMNVINTDTGILAAEGGPVAITSRLVTTTTNAMEVRAVYVGTLTFAANAQLRAVGARPLALVASGKVYLLQNSLIDVSVGGAGARSMCPGGPTKGQDDPLGAAGGGGGGFGAVGGLGGNGNGDDGPSIGGNYGIASLLPLGPLGGCPGAIGGVGADPGGDGGLGGGALYIVSASEIQLVNGAVINAGGGGGGGGKKLQSQYGDAGGGGGGSGGMILLEAPKLLSAGALAANGGGGGEGSGNGSAGNPGFGGRIDATRANGGSGGSPSGTDGGRGGAGVMIVGEPPGGPDDGGAGGGGGGVGFIRVVSPDHVLGAMVSPLSTN
jgi:hypothetical protein